MSEAITFSAVQSGKRRRSALEQQQALLPAETPADLSALPETRYAEP